MFTINITKSAMRQLNRIPSNTKQTVIRKIRHVAVDPHAPNNNIKALRRNGILRLRIGNWRVLYAIDSESETLTVINILPRGRAYR